EPDALDVVPLREAGRLPRCEPCGEAVHRVTKTVELAAGRADFPELPIVGLHEVLHVALDSRRRGVELSARSRLRCGKAGRTAFVACGARFLQLHEID